jgi:PRTRC genetic system protein A
MTTGQNPALIGYMGQPVGSEFPPPRLGSMFDYVLTASGLFLHASRESLEVCFPIGEAQVRGLGSVEPLFNFRLPRVPEDLVRDLWTEAADYGFQKLETLFHLVWSPVYPWNDGWELVTPEQDRRAGSCRPLEDGPGSSHEKAIIEIHSHHSMKARFSPTDDQDETGFRLYGVLGRLETYPQIRLRVGVYGYFWEIPASWALDLPDGLLDCIEEGGEA